MKFLIAFAVVIAVAVARPDDKDAHIISQQGGINLDGSYTTKWVNNFKICFISDPDTFLQSIWN